MKEIPITVAVVDDQPGVAETMAVFLRKIGCSVDTFQDAKAFISRLKRSSVDIVITDVRMPEIDGITVLKCIKDISPSTDVIVVTGHADKAVAIQALKHGAFDLFEKPVDGNELIETVKRTVRWRAALQERDRFADQVSFLSEREAEKWGLKSFVGKTKAIRHVLTNIQTVQPSSSACVLITGESGTGKELVARAIHFGGPRAQRPFVALNCSAIPADLAESMLFGHVKGSFTGAVMDRKGHFQLADGGTLFLDEIGDMPAAVQVKLLRVLDDGVIMPVGGTRERTVDVRVVAATNADLQDKIARGQFRSDLYYRLAGFTIALPPLRDRKEDIPLLAEHFVKELSAEMGRAPSQLSQDVLRVLQSHNYPGNVRELKNLMERALLESAGKEIMPEHIHFLNLRQAIPAQSPHGRSGTGDAGDPLPLSLHGAEDVLIRKAMAESDGNVAAAARLLGINRTKLYRKLAALQGGEKHPPR